MPIDDDDDPTTCHMPTCDAAHMHVLTGLGSFKLFHERPYRQIHDIGG